MYLYDLQHRNLDVLQKTADELTEKTKSKVSVKIILNS